MQLILPNGTAVTYFPLGCTTMSDLEIGFLKSFGPAGYCATLNEVCNAPQDMIQNCPGDKINQKILQHTHTHTNTYTQTQKNNTPPHTHTNTLTHKNMTEHITFI